MKIRIKRHIRIKRRSRINMNTIALYMAMFCVFSYALLEHVSIVISSFSIVKTPLLLVGGGCLTKRALINLGSLNKKKYFYVILTLAFLCLALMISGAINRNPSFGASSLKATFRFALFLVELFLLMVWLSEEGKSEEAINFLFKYLLLILVVTDALFLTGIKTFYSGRHELFLVGTKFTVSYYHMDLLALWFIRNNMRLRPEGKTKRMAYFAIPFILVIAIRVDCMTGVIGCATMFCLFVIMNTRFQRYFMQLSSPVWLVTFLIGSVVFPFIASRIVSIPFVTYIVEEVFSRSTNLTGRLDIFDAFLHKTHGHLMWGFGINNANLVAQRFFNCANAQNAMLQWVLEVGLFPTLLFVLLMVVIFWQLSKSHKRLKAMPLVVLIYVYIILGMVETTFNCTVIMWLALIFQQIAEKEPQHKAPVVRC